MNGDTSPSSGKIEKLAETITKYPASFVGAVFFIMFWTTYFINVYAKSEDCAYWRGQYEVERTRNDNLTLELLITNGIIKVQQIKKETQDSIIRDHTREPVERLLNMENNLRLNENITEN